MLDEDEVTVTVMALVESEMMAFQFDYPELAYFSDKLFWFVAIDLFRFNDMYIYSVLGNKRAIIKSKKYAKSANPQWGRVAVCVLIPIVYRMPLPRSGTYISCNFTLLSKD